MRTKPVAAVVMAPLAIAGRIELPRYVFGARRNESLIHQTIVTEQANKYQGTKQTKGRSDIDAGGRKPYRQKGTGRARQGSIVAPHYRHGGKALAFQPRDIERKITTKMRRAAIRAALSAKLADRELVVVDAIPVSGVPSTKTAARFIAGITGDAEKCLVVLGDYDETTIKSLRNIAGVTIRVAPAFSTRDVVDGGIVVLTQAAVQQIVTYWDDANETLQARSRSREPVQIDLLRGQAFLDPAIQINQPSSEGTVTSIVAKSTKSTGESAGKEEQMPQVIVEVDPVAVTATSNQHAQDAAETQAIWNSFDVPVDIAMPVEIRSVDAQLVVPWFAGVRTLIPSGDYVVSARLPDGDEVTQFMRVPQDESLPVPVSSTPEFNSEDAASSGEDSQEEPIVFRLGVPQIFPEKLEESHSRETFIAPLLRTSPIIERSDSSNERLTHAVGSEISALRRFISHKGGRFHQWRVVQSDSPDMDGALRTNSNLFTVTHSGRQAIILQICQTGRVPRNVVLPGAITDHKPASKTSSPSSALIGKADSGVWNLEIRVADTLADTIARYKRCGFEREAVLLANREIDARPKAKDVELASPLALALLSYQCLEQKRMAPLIAWEPVIQAVSKQLPDSIIVLAEASAQRGYKETAKRLLLEELPEAGLPMLTLGLARSVRLMESLFSQELDQRIASTPHRVYAWLRSYSQYADSREPFMNFVGVDPTRPEYRTLDRDNEWTNQLRGIVDLPSGNTTNTTQENNRLKNREAEVQNER